MKPVIEINEVSVDNAVGDVFTLYIHNMGKTSIHFDESWELCDASHVDAVESESGEFYRPIAKNILEVLEDFGENCQEINNDPDLLVDLFQEDFTNETYAIYYDRIGKDGKVKELNVKFPKTFGWGVHSAEELEERSVHIFKKEF